MPFTLTSTAFTNGGEIPLEHTCKGADRSPPLTWSGAPAGTKSFALIIDDPDAPDPAKPQRIWVHWLLYNLPADCRALPTAVTEYPAGALHGVADNGRTGYHGPCPPIGRHRYFLRLYALDTVLPDLGRPKRRALDDAMRGHVLAEAVLMGTFPAGRSD